MRHVRLFWLALLILIVPASSFAGVLISVNIAPPVLPVYEQPPCPGDGYIWTPGYWAYGPEGYYWVPGTWVVPPTVGVLWTPGYWGWGDGVYVWHAGYWGPHIGFYGGVNYGFGYFGNGYEGGYWRDRHFYYNRTVNNVTINNVHIYNKTVINNVTVNRISYNGGRGGINARPTHEQEMWGREHHYEATSLQRGHERDAGHNREFFASQNHGRPPVAATSRPREFQGPRVMPTREARAPFSRPEARPIPGPSGRDRSYDRPMSREETHGGRDRSYDRPTSREEMHGGRPPQSGRDYRPENAGPRDNGHGHDNGSPHGNAGPHDNRGPHGNGNPHENGPQHEGHSDHGHN